MSWSVSDPNWLKTAPERIAKGLCPSCEKPTTEVNGWLRCPDGACYGRPIEFRVEVVYRFVPPPELQEVGEPVYIGPRAGIG